MSYKPRTFTNLSFSIFLFFVLFVLLSGNNLSAESITLEEIRVLALANSQSLVKHNLSIRSTVLDERSRIFSNLPSFSLGASASMSLWSAEGAAPIENPIDTLSSGASASASMRIFEGGRTLIQKSINSIASESARNEALSEYFNVLDSTDNAYYAVLEAAATLEAEESSLQTSIISLSIAEIRQANGMISAGEYLRALAEKEGRENSRNQARRNLALSITRLRAIAGLPELPALEPIDFSGYEELIQYLGNINDDQSDSLYGQFWRLLVAANPSLSRAALANQRAERNLSMARTGFSPSLGASVSTGLNFQGDDGVQYSGGRLSLSASIPVDFWTIANNVQRSRLALDSTVQDYISAESNLETELQSALLNTFSFAGSVLSTRRSLEYTERHFEYVMARYRLTQSSVSELEEATTLLINSRNNNIRMNYGFLQSLSRLRSLLAIDDEERLVRLLLGN